MTISNDLMYAILAMDAYNREYNAGIVISGQQVGTAAFKDHEQSGITLGEYTEWQDAGFYAAAYSYTYQDQTGEHSETVIPYRGTDGVFFGFGDLFGTDFPIAFNNDFNEDSVHLASKFYRSVARSSAGAITTTGYGVG